MWLKEGGWIGPKNSCSVNMLKKKINHVDQLEVLNNINYDDNTEL